MILAEYKREQQCSSITSSRKSRPLSGYTRRWRQKWSQNKSRLHKEDYHTYNVPVSCQLLAADLQKKWKHCRYQTRHHQPTKRPNKFRSQYAEEFVAKTICCADVYEEQDLNETFIRELEKYIRQKMRGYWSTRQAVRLPNLTFCETWPLQLQEGHQGMQSNNTARNKY